MGAVGIFLAVKKAAPPWGEWSIGVIAPSKKTTRIPRMIRSVDYPSCTAFLRNVLELADSLLPPAGNSRRLPSRYGNQQRQYRARARTAAGAGPMPRLSMPSGVRDCHVTDTLLSKREVYPFRL
jgi:hypothetical protein